MRKAYALAASAIPILLAACAGPPVNPLPSRIDARPTAPAAAPPLTTLGPNLAPGAVNPDVMQDNIAVTICARGWTAKIRPPASFTDRLKLAQMPLYGYPAGTDPKSIEEDHREPLEVGGAPRDPRNLWPMPRDAARAKNRLENAVKRDVCAGRLTLQQGQAIFLGDYWYEYYRRFGSRETLTRFTAR